MDLRFDLPKAYESVQWLTLWIARLRQHDVPRHLFQLLGNVNDEQFGEDMGEWRKSRRFFHNTWSATRLYLEPTTSHRSSTLSFATIEDKN